MKKFVKTINKKAGEISQETFNILFSIFVFTFVIIPIFVIGIDRWLSTP